MAQQSSKQRAEAEVLDLKGKLRQLNKAVADKGATIDENAPLVATIKAVEGLKVGGEELVLTLYKPEQFRGYPDDKLPPMKVSESAAKTSIRYAFAQAKSLRELPTISGSERINDISYFCNGCSSISSATLGNMPLVSDASYAFTGCSYIEQITLGDIGGSAKFDDFARFCAKLRTLTIGNTPNATSINSIVDGCPLLEEFTSSFGDKLNNIRYAFQRCKSLRRINGVLNFGGTTDYTNVFAGCTSLEEVRIKGLKASLDLSACANLSMESVRYLVDNAQTVTGQSIDLSRKLLETHEEELGELGDTASDKGFTFNYR
nr:MAG TPA: leucine-rich repeat protein [Caudoviricetes sp.]